MSAESFFAEREYQLGHSLRFDHVAAHKLSRTPAAAGNRKTWTWSAWVKRGFLSTQHNPRQVMMGVNNVANDTQTLEIGWHSDDKFYITTQSAVVQTSQLFRDPSAWYHIVVVANTTLAGDTDRFKLYVNGVDQSLGELTSVSQNEDTAFNQAALHTIGDGSAGRDLDGYLSEVHFLDGYAYGPEYFGTTGEFDEEWLPIQYTGAYGTNGFYLNFSGEGTMLATGGTISTDSDYKVHQFTSSGTFTPTIVPGTKAFVQYLVIGGGGGGSSGGGGAGGYKEGFLDVVQGTGLTVTIGAGGALGGAASRDGYQGANSVFSTITSIGGGAAGGGDAGGAPGNAGGSGGGGGGGNNSVVGGGQNNGGGAGTTGDDASSNQGNNGGYGWTDANSYGIGGGGGGAGAAGSNAAEGGPGGNGGNGVASSITGSSVTRAGGGGGGGATGGGNKDGGSAGSGGAGAGGDNDDTGTAGTANTGSGGGGGGGSSNGGAGGSGIVIIRYKFQ